MVPDCPVGRQRRVDSTAHFARDLTGVTEVRAGVYAFFDMVMAGIGVCAIDDIAISVQTTVIGHQKERGWIMVDSGWMALSRDRGSANQAINQGYGLVCDVEGRVLDDLIVASANQEHGVIALRPGSGVSTSRIYRSEAIYAFCPITPALRQHSSTATRSSSPIRTNS